MAINSRERFLIVLRLLHFVGPLIDKVLRIINSLQFRIGLEYDANEFAMIVFVQLASTLMSNHVVVLLVLLVVNTCETFFFMVYL